MPTCRYILILLLGLCSWHMAFAVQKVDPYQLSVPANGQLGADQKSAFDQMIVRVTGGSQALSNPIVAKAESRAGGYMQQYAYQQRDGKRWLSIVFNRSQVESVLTQAGQRFWGDLRPLTLIWYVSEQNSQQNFVADGSDHAQQLHQIAQNLALPVIFPIMDLRDSMAVSTTDVWGNFDQPIIKASQRYQADTALVVKQYSDDNLGTGLSWHLLDLRSNQVLGQGQFNGPSVANLDLQMFQQVASDLAAHFAVVRSVKPGGQIKLTFTHLDNFREYYRVEKFLSGQPSVASIELSYVDNNQYTFDIRLMGQWKDLQAALNLNPTYQADAHDPYLYQRQ
ncbi:MAG: hypothetical protein CENE_00131 [Candidatus Celerinatantimonas neptuna]|nr:MAG: hypothetical protein CENE_00131 [Candidatus Celerinatantimonas neptuna]